ncbi:MAG: peptidase domain-containing ABC transporter [Alphaproteobacteria bacterium]|nr:peptidase domain-containing ABC transporter [Alphaproteobacteria bacterium]
MFLTPLDLRLRTITTGAREQGADLSREDLRVIQGEAPSPAALADWVTQSGLWCKAAQLTWRQLLKMTAAGAVILLMKDGTAAAMIRPDPVRNVVWLKDPEVETEQDGVAVDELRLSQLWSGEVLLIRPDRQARADNEPWDMMWIARVAMAEGAIIGDVLLGAVVLSFVSMVPAMIVMIVIDKVMSYKVLATLWMSIVLVLVVLLFEALLGYVRRQLSNIMALRLDLKMNLFVFKRLLGLPIDYFERTPTGRISYLIGQTVKVRGFVTGKLMNAILDLLNLVIVLPVLFWMSVPMAWMVVGLGGIMAMIISSFIKPVRRIYHRWLEFEVQKNIVLVETLHGIRTIKSLALEPAQRDMWDRRAADAAYWKRRLDDISNWPETLVSPFDTLMTRGVLLVGAYLSISGAEVTSGSVVAFMMIANRVSTPLVSLSKLLQDIEELRASVMMVGLVLNNRPETTTPGSGLRPRFEGGIIFRGVKFTYPGTKSRALDDISFEVPPGTVLGLVGRSGSGKSTITRLLQGINREYEGQIKIDGVDLREINLAHLRRSFGVVLQENFLFRGTVRDNLLAGRTGLTLTDAVRAARLAGAEEFIERMQFGYETMVEEGSPNLSGGQRQRLAIARALIHDPRILILDEATSALDPESEALVNANISRIAANRTMVIVSHRLSSLVDSNMIMVLDRGKMVDIGPHTQLLETCTIYRQLWQQQNRHMESFRSGARAALATSVGS